MKIDVTLVGGPTLILDFAGTRVVTDPTFDPPGSYPEPLVGALVKTAGPAISVDELGEVDVVLASHQHEDNLDAAGREVLKSARHAFTTRVVKDLVGGDATALEAGESAPVAMADGSTLTVHAVQAKHGPSPIWEMVAPVIGFVLTSEGRPTVYISGDNSELDVVEDVARQFGRIDLAVLFAGAAGFDVLGGSNITLDAATAAEAARILDAGKVVLVHTDSWAHFRQDLAAGISAFDAAGLGDRLVPLTPGQSASLEL